MLLLVLAHGQLRSLIASRIFRTVPLYCNVDNHDYCNDQLEQYNHKINFQDL